MNGDTYGLIFSYGFLYRQNHHFRSLIAHYIHEWKAKLPVPFPEDHDCVAVIIRRGDRIAPGAHSMYEWCEKHKVYPNGTCYNDATGIVDHGQNCENHFVSYGCQSATPYGEMSLAKVLNASRVVSQSNNVLVICEDTKWLKEEIAITPTNLVLFPFTPPSHVNYRKSTLGGVSYMAAIETASTCSALVGHRGSAVTMFFYNIMCIRHAGLIGACPPLYDFSE